MQLTTMIGLVKPPPSFMAHNNIYSNNINSCPRELKTNYFPQYNGVHVFWNNFWLWENCINITSELIRIFHMRTLILHLHTVSTNTHVYTHGKHRAVIMAGSVTHVIIIIITFHVHPRQFLSMTTKWIRMQYLNFQPVSFLSNIYFILRTQLLR